MTAKTSTMKAAQPTRDEIVTIQFIKRTVIGEVQTSEFGDLDTMSAFFTAVEGDAREGMHPDKVSVDTYEFTDSLGTTTVSVRHVPSSLS